MKYDKVITLCLCLVHVCDSIMSLLIATYVCSCTLLKDASYSEEACIFSSFSEWELLF